MREQVGNNHPIKFENSDFFRRNFNLTDYSDCPFNKTNNEINYIHKQTNHRPSFIKQLPLSVETRLSKLFSNEKATLSNITISTSKRRLQQQVNILETRP